MTYKTSKYVLFAVLCCLSGSLSAQSLDGANAAFDREDYSAALDQYHKLAGQGDKFAQYRYAMMNYFGLGTEQDLVAAYSWMTTAAEDQTEMMKKFQVLIWNEMDRDQRDAATELAIKNEMKAGTEVMDRKAKTERRRAERAKCTGSRVGNCGSIQSYGVSFSNRGVLDDVRDIPYTMSLEEIAAFEKQYANTVIRDFVKFDENKS